jgi:TrmH family RNA methyltransferase
MLSKPKSSFVKSLQIKKYRQAEQCFLVEGSKSVAEVLQSDFEVIMLVGRPAFLAEMDRYPSAPRERYDVNEATLASLGSFQTNTTGLAVVRMKPNSSPARQAPLVLALDDIRDWYGVRTIVASENTADVYNPKVITATMGSFTRVQVYYTALPDYLRQHDATVYGTFLTGTNVHEVNWISPAILVMGNEAHGISDEVKTRVQQPITIPRVGKAESLNAAIATAIVLDNYARSQK